MAAATNVVEGMLYIYDRPSKVLFDPNSNHSYLSPSFASLINIQHAELPYSLTIITLIGKQVIFHEVYDHCRVKIGDYILLENLISMLMNDFNVILEMDWLVSIM